MKKNRIDLAERLKGKRRRINLIDRKLVILLNQRLSLALEIGRIKKEMRGKVYDPKREKEILEGLISRNKGPLREEDLKNIFGTIMKVCRKSQVEVFHNGMNILRVKPGS